ncbi:MAG: hypothetical protein ACRC9P_02065 [Bacteroides sp.]
MEIKFWDKCNDDYVSTHVDRYFIDNVLDVYKDKGEVDWEMVYCKHIEPHFYKDGERIA